MLLRVSSNALVGTFKISILFRSRFYYRFESIAWIPAAIVLPILLGLGNKHLNPSNIPSVSAPSVAQIMSFATFVASSAVAWCTVTPDYGVYHDSKASS